VLLERGYTGRRCAEWSGKCTKNVSKNEKKLKIELGAYWYVLVPRSCGQVLIVVARSMKKKRLWRREGVGNPVRDKQSPIASTSVFVS